MKTTEPQKKLKSIEVYDITFLKRTDPKYFWECAQENNMTEEEMWEHIKDIEEEYAVIQFPFTNDELEDTDDLEEVLIGFIEEETGEFFEGYNYRFIYEEDLAEQN